MRLPTYFVSHGGGPWPWMKGDLGHEYDRLEASFRDVPRQLGVTPAAVLIVSGHWETREFTVMAHPNPPMLYDYGGFPEHTYHVRYPAPGSPELARRVQSLLLDAGITAGLDDTRGYDHGAFVPMAVIFPEADVPVVQLSLKGGLDPGAHWRAGAAIGPLRDEGVLIVGSGMSYHNLRRMGPSARVPSQQFDDWLHESLIDAAPAQRRDSLMGWTAAPAARDAHPHEEHLIPLMVAVGAAEEDRATRVYHDENLLGGLVVSSYRFGGE
jgi:aromatic ring-opening dioxygenase catalytic subunit (LigB family)